MHRHKNDTSLLSMITSQKAVPFFTPDFIIPAVNSFRPNKLTILWQYQSDPFLNLSNPLFNFKLISHFKLKNLTKAESDFVISKLPPIANVCTISSIDQIKEIDNEYRKPSPSCCDSNNNS